MMKLRIWYWDSDFEGIPVVSTYDKIVDGFNFNLRNTCEREVEYGFIIDDIIFVPGNSIVKIEELK